MNYLVLSKIYRIIKDEEICENSRMKYIKVSSHNDLISKLKEYNYDYNEEEILLDVKYNGIVEEVLSTPKCLILTSDNTKINYNEINFMIKWYCGNKADIEYIGDVKYCRECYEKKNQLSYDKIKEILESKNETYGLTTFDKIRYILYKNIGSKLTSLQIYKMGEPWDLKTMTPRNSVYARLSIMYKNGDIKKEGNLYYI